jgi:alpha-mannosidase
MWSTIRGTTWISPFWIVLILIGSTGAVRAQTACFVDGYHGGVYGHYPDGYTRFIVDTLKQHPGWKINLEIEPETWDRLKTNDLTAYAELQALAADQTAGGRIEFVNPTYAQSYLWNISGESIIRQFQYGIKKVREHFAGAVFSTYSAEEPCFTSALPGILKSLGYRNAALKNPDTCWGGYVRAFGGELVNWVGPDGTGLPTAPRYAVEALQPRSTWQTMAWNNSAAYLEAARNAGIQHPVGMCFQDAGWRNGPWLGDPAARRSEYVTWRGYFQQIASQQAAPDWRLTQEDVQVSLLWGAQVLQRLAQQVRAAENRLVQAEKMAALASFYAGSPYPTGVFDEAWRNLMLAQHHDCWIVPYNGRPGNTWADKVARWTAAAQIASGEVMQQSMRALGRGGTNQAEVRVFNTLGRKRREAVSVALPADWQGPAAKVLDERGQEVVCQLAAKTESGCQQLLFPAEVPALGYCTYRVQPVTQPNRRQGASVTNTQDGWVSIETDLYRIVLDPAKGGVIRSLRSRLAGEKEFVDARNSRYFNEIRGRFYGGQEQFRSGTDSMASVKVLSHGPVRVVVEVTGKVGEHPFTEVISAAQGQRRIDFNLRLDWVGDPGVGNGYGQKERYRQEENQRAFYDDRDKLLGLFPPNLQGQKVYINAPFDVTESRLTNTFFTSWDGIKNNVVLHWLDVTDANGEYGLALLTDHTTSYVHGEDHPLGLVLQYSGIGLWGRHYAIAGPTTVHYALVPHRGRWDQAEISGESAAWNEPLMAVLANSNGPTREGRQSMLELSGSGWEVTTMTVEGKSRFIRLFNAVGDDRAQRLSLDGRAANVSLVELNGNTRETLRATVTPDRRTTVELAIPRFGVRTIRLDDCAP